MQPALAVAGQHFKKRRALAMGIVAGGSSIGGVCLPIMFSHIVPKIGFSWSIRVAALMFLCCYLAAACISWTREVPKKTSKSSGNKLLARRRQAVSALPLFKQGEAERSFQRRDPAGDGRLAGSKDPCARERAALAGHGKETAQVVPVIHWPGL